MELIGFTQQQQTRMFDLMNRKESLSSSRFYSALLSWNSEGGCTIFYYQRFTWHQTAMHTAMWKDRHLTTKGGSKWPTLYTNSIGMEILTKLVLVLASYW